MSKSIAQEVEKIFGIKTINAENYKHALTHTSYTKEKNLPYVECYERLEFLGDAVLKLSISNILYKNYPDYAEGQMSKIRSIVVSDNMLAKIANKIGLSKHILASDHDKKQKITTLESVTACAFEAVLGAYFLDGKLSELMNVLEKLFEEYIPEVDKDFAKYNAKAILQEYTQSKTKDRPFYRLIEERGADHKKTFVVEVTYNGEVLACGEGKTKKDAEQKAAYSACEKLGVFNEQ